MAKACDALEKYFQLGSLTYWPEVLVNGIDQLIVLI